MPKPKEKGENPIRKGIRFVRKANKWCYFETFNKLNVSDKIEWFDTEEEVIERAKTT